MAQTTRPTFAEIDLRALAFNLSGIRRAVGRAVKVLGVVKANAYGHGLTEVARFLEGKRVEYLGVALAEEGSMLREADVRLPILVFTLPSKGQIQLYFDHSLQPTVCTVADCRMLQATAERIRKRIPVHLKIETGMNRIGVRPSEIPHFLKAIRSMRRIEITGVYTHFATADESDKRFVRRQLREFQRGLEELRAAGIEPELVHAANSAAILDLPESHFSMVRPGILMYGYYPSQQTTESIPVRRVLSFKTQVAMVKWIEPGDAVSYGRRFIARRRTKIATLSVGYADGFSRLLTGRASVLIGGERFPVVGTICMDQITVDVGRSDVGPGDTAVLIGQQRGKTIDAWELASHMGTIPYEICTNISARVPRVYRAL